MTNQRFLQGRIGWCKEHVVRGNSLFLDSRNLSGDYVGASGFVVHRSAMRNGEFLEIIRDLL
jgi:hypothetical protein